MDLFLALIAPSWLKAENPVSVGSIAPDFTFQYFDGSDLKSVKLSDYRGKKNVVLAFYIFAFTGGCSQQMKNLQQSRIEATDTEVLGVSMDSPFVNKAFADRLGVTFPLLSDWGGEVTKQYSFFVHGYKAARRVNLLIGKDGTVLEMQTDKDAIDPTKTVMASVRLPSQTTGGASNGVRTPQEPTGLDAHHCVERASEYGGGTYPNGNQGTYSYYLVFRNTCAKPVHIHFCYSARAGCWACNMRTDIYPGKTSGTDAAATIGAVCRTQSCDELSTQWNATYVQVEADSRPDEIYPRKPDVETSCQTTAH